MKISALRWSPPIGWDPPAASWPPSADLVLYFGAREQLADSNGPHTELCSHFSTALCAGCSTAGEISGGAVTDGSVSAVCIEFTHTSVRAESIDVQAAAASFHAAATLGRRLTQPDLRHVLVLSDGLVVNGSSLTAGFRANLPEGVHVTGGLAGDGSRFQSTVVGLGPRITPGQVVAIGFYGSHFQVSHGSAGGWAPFGPRRLVTRSEGNVLFAVDDQPALELYKRYLGTRAPGLPATGLLFPLQLLARRDAEHGLVRTILAVDESQQSLTFAGDIPQGQYVRLMKASFDALIGGAETAARSAARHRGGFALLVSCVGRRLVMGQRVEEEIEAALAQLDPAIVSAGFYSYGEICPSGLVHGCDLHNQTLTLTVFSEDT